MGEAADRPQFPSWIIKPLARLEILSLHLSTGRVWRIFCNSDLAPGFEE